MFFIKIFNRAMNLPDKEELYGGKFDLEKEMYIDVKNYIREKSGLYYAVMVYTNVRGERKEKWFPTKLPVKGNKTKAEAFSRMVLREFKIPREDLCYDTFVCLLCATIPKKSAKIFDRLHL